MVMVMVCLRLWLWLWLRVMVMLLYAYALVYLVLHYYEITPDMCGLSLNLYPFYTKTLGSLPK